jgi:hypothetical protein
MFILFLENCLAEKPERSAPVQAGGAARGTETGYDILRILSAGQNLFRRNSRSRE